MKAKYHTTHPHRQGPNGEPAKLVKRRKTKREGRAPDTIAVIEARKKQRLKRNILSLENRVRKLASMPPLKSMPTKEKSVKGMEFSQIEKNLEEESLPPIQKMELRSRKLPAKRTIWVESDSLEEILNDLPDDEDLRAPIEDSRHIRGVQWKSNSCPLDSSLEAIYQTLYPFLPIIQDPLQPSRDTILFSTVHMLDNRKRWEEDLTLDGREFSAKITEAKIHLRSMMIARGIIRNERELVDYGVRCLSSLFALTHKAQGWLDWASRKESDIEWELLTILSGSRLHIERCDASNNDQEHIKLATDAILQPAIETLGSVNGAYKGNTESLAQNVFLGILLGGTNCCWHTKEGITLCPGSCTKSYPWVTIPLVLTVRLEDEAVLISKKGKKKGETAKTDEKTPWLVPPLISFTQESVTTVYKLQSLVTHSKKCNHFQTIYQTEHGIYRYDGMKPTGDTGIAARMALDCLETAGRALEGDWKILGLYYRLEGGSAAQKLFQEAATARIQTQHSININGNGTSIWLNNPSFVRDPDAWKMYRKNKDKDMVEWRKRRKPFPRPLSHPDYILHPPQPIIYEFDPSISYSLPVECRCGAKGNSSTLPAAAYILCIECKSYSHLSCIDGGADLVMHDELQAEYFICGLCNDLPVGIPKQPEISEVPLLQYVLPSYFA